LAPADAVSVDMVGGFLVAAIVHAEMHVSFAAVDTGGVFTDGVFHQSGFG